MLFAAYLGVEGGFPAWHRAVQHHAVWLGMNLQADARRIGDGRTFAFAFLRPASGAGQYAILPQAKPYVLLSAHGGIHASLPVETDADLRRWLTDEEPPVDVRIGVRLQTGELKAAVPPASLEPLNFARVPGGWMLSNDLRLVARMAGAKLDDSGVYGLFRHSIVPAPMTLFRGVQGVPAGHLLKLSRESEDPSMEVFFHLSLPSGGEPQPQIAEARVRDTLDEILAATPSSPIVCFSGGMDSSLIAARFAAMGRKDVTLVNCAFGPQDQHGQKALKIAAHLGLRCEQVMWNPAGIPDVVSRIGTDYPFPFGDPSFVPGNLLAHELFPFTELSGMAIHGVGTGGMFGQRLLLKKRLKPLYNIPNPIRRVAAGAYKWFGLWKHSSEVERAAGFLRRSLEPPVMQPRRVGQHPMEGIAYTIPPDVNARLVGLIQHQTGTFAAGQPGPEGMFSLVMHLQRQVSAIMAGPLALRGARTFGPFTEPRMVRCAFSLQMEEKCPGGVPRGLLRNILSQSIPSEWIHLPGHSFIAPFYEIYEHPAMRALANDVVLSPDNPLLAYCNARVMAQMLARVQNRQPLSVRARKFLWTFVFASAWLRQISEGR